MRRSPIALILLLLPLLALSACASGRGPDFNEGQPESMIARPAATMVPPMEAPAAEVRNNVGALASANAQPDTDQLQEARLIIYNANMFLIVEDTEEAAKQIDDLATGMGGYVASMNGYRQDESMIYDITIRIPADKFESGRAALRNIAVRVENESLGTDDVTDEYYDIDARLQTLEATEDELTQLLERTEEQGGDVEDIMKIYDRLTQIRSEIESLQGQLNRLEKLVAFSTIAIHLEPHILAQPIEGENWRPAEIVRKSIDQLLEVLTVLATLLIQFVIVVLPVLLLLLLPLVVLLWLINRWQKRKRASKTGRDAKDSGE